MARRVLEKTQINESLMEIARCRLSRIETWWLPKVAEESKSVLRRSSCADKHLAGQASLQLTGSAFDVYRLR
jgi:hypothetical protein